MIEGHNPTSLSDYEFENYAQDIKGPMSIQAVVDNLEKRRKNSISGGVNCIPFPFQRFRSEVPGIEQGQYVIITANEKTGKSQCASYIYLYNVLEYAFCNPQKCSVHIVYFPFEESIQKIIERYMVFLLWHLDGIHMSPSDLRSTTPDYPVDKKVLDLLQTDKYKKRLEFFEQCVEFDTENTNPTGILRKCEAYAKSVGKCNIRKIPSANDPNKIIDVFDSYEQDDPNHYKILILDHVGLVDKEQGFKTKDAIDKVSEYMVKYLRNRYNYTCVVIQQQAAEVQGLEAIKMKKMVPSTGSLGDTKYTARDANLVLGLFDPSKFGLPTWLSYKIQPPDGIGLQNYARFLYVLANRDGEMGGVCPLFFDGAVCDFVELPLPSSPEINRYYDEAKKRKEMKRKRKQLLLSIFDNNKNKKKNG